MGWGGLSEAFDEKNGAWYNEYQKLKSLLSPEEYASARESTLNAHYTSPIIIRSIYDTLGRMGFEKGNILEPSIGIGNFFDAAGADAGQPPVRGGAGQPDRTDRKAALSKGRDSDFRF